MEFLFLFAVAYGICFGLMNRKLPGFSEWLISRQIRVEGEGEDKTTFFGRMLVCPYCTGFHAGWMAWLLVRFASYASHTFSLERLATNRGRRRGRPPKWMAEARKRVRSAAKKAEGPARTAAA